MNQIGGLGVGGLLCQIDSHKINRTDPGRLERMTGDAQGKET